MHKQCPCKECITFVICKVQMQPYLEQNNRRVSTIGLMQELDPKCKPVTAYIKGLITKERKRLKVDKLQPKNLIQHLHEIAMEIFG